MRFVLVPPADTTAGLLSLPWGEPLTEWTDDRIVELRQRGISRHVVRFVAEGGEVYALKELDERLAPAGSITCYGSFRTLRFRRSRWSVSSSTDPVTSTRSS